MFILADDNGRLPRDDRGGGGGGQGGGGGRRRRRRLVVVVGGGGWGGGGCGDGEPRRRRWHEQAVQSGIGKASVLHPPSRFPHGIASIAPIVECEECTTGWRHYRRSRGTAIVVVPAVLDRQRRRHHWQWRRCDRCPLALIVGDGVCELNFLCIFRRFCAHANNIAS